MTAPPDDFYIGYQRRAPAGLGVFLRRVTLGLLIVGAVLGATLAALQKPFEPGVFEYLQYRTFEGTVREEPYPLLEVDRPGATVGRSAYLLTVFGKRGAGGEVEGLDGRRVRLEGALIHARGQTMIELVAGSVESLDTGVEAPGAAADLGRHTLVGEIVDSKCYLGVMRPGRAKPHRGCAARCISGGVPPLLMVESAGGERRHFLLVDEAGGAVNRRVLDFVAEPVEITGSVRREGDLLLLAADPASIRRLRPERS